MRKKLLGMIYLLVGLTACVSAARDGLRTPGPNFPANSVNAVESATTTGPIPYLTASLSPTSTPLPPMSGLILSTATAVSYTVVYGETLGSIALRFGISLDILMAANPGVDPNNLPIGTVLKIPAGESNPGVATPTPLSVMLLQAHCWPSADGGLWCFSLVQNKYAQMIEDLSAQFTLLDVSGREIASQTVFALLDILPAGQSIPIAAFFPPPSPAEVTPRVQILTAILISLEDKRYLPVTLQNTLVEVDWTGRTAHVSGQAFFTRLDGNGITLWILGVAYDKHDNVVGVRRWEYVAPVAGGSSIPFDFPVSSVGPGIDRVDLLVEARP